VNTEFQSTLSLPHAQPRNPLRLFSYFHPVVAFIHLASLDAPIIAALWCLFFAATAHIALPLTAPLFLFLCVWILYIADRLLDARPLDARQPNAPRLEARHHFHARHARVLLACVAAAALVLLLLIPRHMPFPVFREYLSLASLLPIYFLQAHRPIKFSRRSPSLFSAKEIAVGLFFGAATIVPTWARSPQSHASLLPAAALFAALCWLNCIAIETWESQPHSSLPRAAVAIAILSAIISLAAHPAPLRYTAIACTLSALLLLALHHARHRFSRLTLRIAADAALLTPLLLLPLLHLNA